MDDLSRNTIVVLALLTLVISIIGTWTLISEINSVGVSSGSSRPADTGTMSLKITTPGSDVPVSGAATGQVVFKIVDH